MESGTEPLVNGALGLIPESFFKLMYDLAHSRAFWHESASLQFPRSFQFVRKFYVSAQGAPRGRMYTLLNTPLSRSVWIFSRYNVRAVRLRSWGRWTWCWHLAKQLTVESSVYVVSKRRPNTPDKKRRQQLTFLLSFFLVARRLCSAYSAIAVLFSSRYDPLRNHTAALSWLTAHAVYLLHNANLGELF